MRKLSRITGIIFITILLFLPCNFFEINSCQEIDEIFSNVTSEDDQSPCRCYYDHSESSFDLSDYDKIWIGCTQQNLPIVFRTLNSVNETFLSKLVIWNSLINILPSDMFAKVRPRELSIESSMLAVFRPGAFDNIGKRLKKLSLRNNIIKNVDSFIFKEITALEELDISKNKLPSVTTDMFNLLTDLKSLLLEGNQISTIEDGAFEGLHKLTILNLANNKIRHIKKNTFKNLSNLEVLNLSGNQITTIDSDAFSHMKKLRILNLGKNGLSKIEVRGLPELQHVYFYNNQIDSLRDINLRNLPSLTTISFDRNGINIITNDDFIGLGQSTRLSTVTLSTNAIEDIESRAFDPIHGLRSLSLHGNLLNSFQSKKDNSSYLSPLKKIEHLDMSKNSLKEINNDDISNLPNLNELILGHNQIQQISKKAFKNLRSLTKLFLNNNKLYFLPEGIFDDVNINILNMVDLSNNFWECICGQEWLGQWLKSIGQANAANDSLGCLIEECKIDENHNYHPSWITIIAFCLFLVTISCIAAISYLIFIECQKNWPNKKKPVASDKERLISETLSFPNPVNFPDNISVDQRIREKKSDNKVLLEKKHVRFS